MSSSSSALIPPERETYALSCPGIIFFFDSTSLGKLMFFSCNSFVTCRLRWEAQQMRNKISCESGCSSGLWRKFSIRQLIAREKGSKKESFSLQKFNDSLLTNYLLRFTGKSQTEKLLTLGQYGKAELWDFSVRTKRSRIITCLLYVFCFAFANS